MASIRPAHKVNHVGFVLDKSDSMSHLRHAVVKVIDAQVRSLAEQTKVNGQETRVSVWTFGYNVENIVWDMDVLRLPSIAEFYRTEGMTALVAGATIAIEDLKTVPEKYGDHAFLLYVATDGMENYSHHVPGVYNTGRLSGILRGLPDNWTVAALVPDTAGVARAKDIGFPAGNIDKWDATSVRGVEEAGERIAAATSSYMVSRATGTRSTTSLFDTSSATLNPDAIKAAGMREANPASYMLHFIPPVTSPFPKAMKYRQKFRIDDYVKVTLGMPFHATRNYYELVKSETIEPQKDIALVERQTGKVYIGREARDVIGLPNQKVRIRPSHNDKFFILIRSDSTNRKLPEGSRLLILT